MASTHTSFPDTTSSGPTPDANNKSPSDPSSTETPSTAATTETTTTAAVPTPVDPLTALSSMWSGWLSPSPSSTTSATTGTQQQQTPSSLTTTEDAAAAATAAASDLFEEAGRMWNDIGATLKGAAADTVASVDTSKLNEQVDVLRQQSGKLMDDVTKSVQSLNITLPSANDIDISKSAQVITSQTRDFIDKASQSIEKGRKEALEIFVDENETLPEQQTTTTTSIENNNISSNTSKPFAPWDVAGLPESEKKYADILRREMLKLVVDAIYSKKKRTNLFLSDIAHKRGFQFDINLHSAQAIAALDADKNMRRLRAGLVPGKMKEEVFWTTYFYHVHRIRQTLVANSGVMPDVNEEEDDDDDDLFGDDNVGKSGNGGVAGREHSKDNDDVAADDNEIKGDDKERKNNDSVDSGEKKKEDGGDGDDDGKGRNWEEDIDKAFDDL